MADPRIDSIGLDDGTCQVAVRRWTPGGNRRGSILMLHGIQSHGGWYLNSCGQLADAGFEVLLPDRRGSGLNPTDRGDAPSFRRLLDDIAEMLPLLAPPRILIGISWGGKLAVAFQRRHPGLTHALVLVTPGLCQRVGLSIIQSLRVAASRFVAPRRQFPIPLNEPELFTANPERQKFIRDDPLALRRATARLLFESARMTVYNRWAVRHVSVPTLVLLAECDRIIDNSQTRRRVGQFANRDVTIQEYPRAGHTLEFEPGGPPFIADLLSWIEQRNLATKIKQRAGHQPAALLPEKNAMSTPMPDIRIETHPARRVLFLRHVGPYSSVGPTFQKLMGFAFQRGLFRPDTLLIGICHDDPEVTPADKIRCDCAITVGEDVAPTGEFGIQTIDGGEFAVATHRGPYETLSTTYRGLYGGWLPTSGREPRNAPPFEIYRNSPFDTKPEDLVTDIFLPLSPK